jgi:O-antigen/teichoic acid export membrane protein
MRGLPSRVIRRFRSFLSLDSPDLTRRAYLNSVASGVEYAARALTQFFVTPVLVHGLGSHDYGLWILLGRLTGYLTAASGRSPQALKWTIAKQQSSQQYDAKRQSVASAGIAELLFLPGLALLGGILVWFTPGWLRLPPELYWTIRIVGAILVARLIVTNVAALPRSVLEGENLGYRLMGLTAAIALAAGGLKVLAIYFGTGLVGVAGATLAAALLSVPLFVLLARSHVQWFGLAWPKRAEVRSFLQLSIWFLLWKFVNQLMISGDIVVLGFAKSAEVVSTYSLTKYIPEILILLVGIPVIASFPGLGGLLGSGDFTRVARLRGELMLLSWLLITVFGAGVLLWNETFLGLWVGAEHYAGATATLLIVLMISQYVMIRTDANIIDLTLDVSRKVLLGAFSVALSIAAAALAVTVLDAGIVGLCGGLILGRSILSLVYPRMVGRILHLPKGSQLRAILRPALTTALLFAVCLALGSRLGTTTFSPGWLGLILFGPLSAAALLFVAFTVGLSSAQRALVRQRLRRLFAAVAPR